MQDLSGYFIMNSILHVERVSLHAIHGSEVLAVPTLLLVSVPRRNFDGLLWLVLAGPAIREVIQYLRVDEEEKNVVRATVCSGTIHRLLVTNENI